MKQRQSKQKEKEEEKVPREENNEKKKETSKRKREKYGVLDYVCLIIRLIGTMLWLLVATSVIYIFFFRNILLFLIYLTRFTYLASLETIQLFFEV